MNKPPFLIPRLATCVVRSGHVIGCARRRFTLALLPLVVTGLAASSAAPRRALFLTAASSVPPPPAMSRSRARMPARSAMAPRKRASEDQAVDAGRGGAHLNVERRGHVAVALGHGRVLIIGGENDRGLVKQSELFDLGSRSFSLGAGLIRPRTDAVALRLANGRVLVLGGRNYT